MLGDEQQFVVVNAMLSGIRRVVFVDAKLSGERRLAIVNATTMWPTTIRCLQHNYFATKDD